MAEILYGSHDDANSIVMSERVQNLASSVYREFECMIGTYGDGVVKGLMPQVVSILENLNQVYREKQEQEVEIELLRVENDNLKMQFEREKQLRKTSEQKYLEGDDLLEEEKKIHLQKLEVAESNLRRLEVKNRNIQEQLLRHEEKESEMKNDYSKLHSRYTELFKTHADHLERYKILMEKSKESPIKTALPAPPVLRHVVNSLTNDDVITLELQSTENVNRDDSDVIHQNNNKRRIERNDLDSTANKNASHDSTDLDNATNNEVASNDTERSKNDNEIVKDEDDPVVSVSKVDGLHGNDIDRKNEITNKKDATDGGITMETLLSNNGEWSMDADANVDECLAGSYGGSRDAMLLTSVEFDDGGLSDETQMIHFNQTNEKLLNMSSIYDELAVHDTEALGEMDEGVNLKGVTAEIEKLIIENNDLLETKNALNIVKDDLISKVDELTGEQELMHEELALLQATKERQTTRIGELEDEMKKFKEELEETKAKAAYEDEDAQKKCFTRIDMTRVVMERNQFKEKLIELQEAVRWAEMLRASREHPDLLKTQQKRKSSLWNFFSGLVRGGSDSDGGSDPTQKHLQKKPPNSSKPPTVI